MKIAIYLLVLMSIVTGCSAVKTDDRAEALKTLDTYLHAFVDKDEARMSGLICPKWSSEAMLEYDSFLNVKTKLEGLSCNLSSSDPNTYSFTCKGKILASYTNEAQEFDLSQRTYRLDKVGADWQVCGYTSQ